MADSWFLQLWKGLGDHMADTEDKTEMSVVDFVSSPNNDETVIVTSPDHPLWENSALIPDPSNPEISQRRVPVKHMNPQRFEDIVLLHEIQCGADAVSPSTLRRCWHDRWCSYLPIRNIGQGKRCKICAELSEERVQATTPEEQALVRERAQFHIDSVMADRNHSVRCNHIAERDAKVVSRDGLSLTCKLVIDGMDQAKWRAPRNLASSAEFDALWRPQLHVTGCIWHGVLEAYFIMPPDIAKDSNMNATVINRMFDLVRETQEGAMPRNLIINSDNTTRESKNQFFLATQAMLVSQDKFDTVDQEFPKTGHTHNEIDQRFSSVSTTLNRAPVLENMEEFRDWTLTHLKPARGRKLVVEILDGSMNFQEWQIPLNLNIAGLAAHKYAMDTNHSWKLVQRKALGTVDPDLVIESQHPDWVDLEQHPNDVILMCKESISSSTLSQRPLLVLPYVVANKISADALQPAQRIPFSEGVLREYRKTAAAITKAPWNLLTASAWLNDLCDKNEAGAPCTPYSFKFLSDYVMPDVATGHDSDQPMLHAPQPPQVQIGKPTASQLKTRSTGGAPGPVLKRPAASGPSQPKRQRPAPGPGPVDGVAALVELYEEIDDLFDEVAAAPGPPAPSGDADLDAANAALYAAEQSQHDFNDDLEKQLMQAVDAVAPAPLDAAAPAIAVPPLLEPPYAPPVYAEDTGCSKCRWAKRGCKECRVWAAAGLKGYYFGGPDPSGRPRVLFMGSNQ